MLNKVIIIIIIIIIIIFIIIEGLLVELPPVPVVLYLQWLRFNQV